MTTRTNYTDEEWKNIKAAPLLAWMYVSMIAKSAPIDTAKETLAISQSLADLVKKGSANQLIATYSNNDNTVLDRHMMGVGCGGWQRCMYHVGLFRQVHEHALADVAQVGRTGGQQLVVQLASWLAWVVMACCQAKAVLFPLRIALRTESRSSGSSRISWWAARIAALSAPAWPCSWTCSVSSWCLAVSIASSSLTSSACGSSVISRTTRSRWRT